MPESTLAPPIPISNLQPIANGIITARLTDMRPPKTQNPRGPKTIGHVHALEHDVGFSSFRPLDGFQHGDTVRLTGCSIEAYNGVLRITIRDRTQVELVERAQARRLALRDVKPNGELVDVEVRVVTARALDGTNGIAIVGTLSDGTATTEFYQAPGAVKLLQVGQVVRIEHAIARPRGTSCSLILASGHAITEIDAPALHDVSLHRRAHIADAQATRIFNASTRAQILQVRNPSGVVFRCPECRKTLRDSVCTAHGIIQGGGEPALAARILVEDDSGQANLMARPELVEALTGMTLLSAMQSESRTTLLDALKAKQGTWLDIVGDFDGREGSTTIWDKATTLAAAAPLAETVAAPSLLTPILTAGPSELEGRLLEAIRAHMTPTGAPYEAVVEASAAAHNDAEQALNALQDRGEIYEPTLGWLRFT